MGRLPTKIEGEKKKGPWTREEDLVLVSDIQENGPGNWTSIPSRTGLKRDAKSCRFRWMNYLQPDLKRGNFTSEEDIIIVQLQAIMGNKWAGIAHYLPGRTANDVKNHWRAYLKKKVDGTSGNRNDDNQDSVSSRRRWERSIQENVYSTRKALLDALVVSPPAPVSLSPPAPVSNSISRNGFGSPFSMSAAPLLWSSLMTFKPPSRWNQSTSHEQAMINTQAFSPNENVASLVSHSGATQLPAPELGSPLLMETSLQQSSEIVSFNPSRGWTQSASQQQVIVPADDQQLHSGAVSRNTRASTYSTTTKPYDLVDIHQPLMITIDNHQLRSRAASQITQDFNLSSTTEPNAFSGDNVVIGLQSWNKQIPKSRLDNIAACPPPVPADPAVFGRELEYFPPPTIVDPASFFSLQKENDHIWQQKMHVLDDQVHRSFY